MKIKLIALVLMGVSMVAFAKDPMEFDKLWNYDKPDETETKFRSMLPEAEKSGDQEYYLQLLTQIARTQSLQRKFDEAHKILDSVEPQLGKTTPIAEVRYLLERGRTYNSAKKISEAMPLFLKAFNLSIERKMDFYAIDAAHMVAIPESNPEKQMEWNLKAVKLAEGSKEERAQGWLGSLYNNIGWTYHDTGRYPEALEIFQKALVFREKKGDISTIRMAKWCIGRTFRSLKRYDEAFKILRALEADFAKTNEKDGYVFEELAELLLVTEKKEEAKKYFGLAYDELSKDIWLKENEQKRLERLKELGGR